MRGDPVARRQRKVEAAEALKITAPDLLALGIIDEIVPEPVGGAHTDPDAAAALVDQALVARRSREVAGARPSTTRLRARATRSSAAMGEEGSAFVDTAYDRPR